MIHALRWQRSTFSGGGEGNTCIELAVLSPHSLGLRESDTPATVLTTTSATVTEFLHAIASGGFSSPPSAITEALRTKNPRGN